MITIEHSLDEDGVPIVSIPVSNSNKNATLFEEDYNLLVSIGVDPRWRLSANCVLAKGKSPIARLIADAKSGETIRYKDRDSLNLKRDNLVTVIGAAGRSNAREKLAEKPVTFRETVKVNHIHMRPSWEIAEQLNGYK